jgi:hypothetical protein
MNIPEIPFKPLLWHEVTPDVTILKVETQLEPRLVLLTTAKAVDIAWQILWLRGNGIVSHRTIFLCLI